MRTNILEQEHVLHHRTELFCTSTFLAEIGLLSIMLVSLVKNLLCFVKDYIIT